MTYRIMQVQVDPEDLKPGDVVIEVSGDDHWEPFRIMVEREVQDLTAADLDLIEDAAEKARWAAIRSSLETRYGHHVTDIMVSNVVSALENPAREDDRSLGQRLGDEMNEPTYTPGLDDSHG